MLLEPKELPLLTMNPRKMEDIIFTEQLTKECIEIIIRNIPNGSLSKAELELIWMLFLNLKMHLHSHTANVAPSIRNITQNIQCEP